MIISTKYNIKVFILISFLLFSFNSYSQSNSDKLINNTVSAFKSNQPNKISANFNTTVDLLIGDVDDSFSKKQAAVIFSKFINKNKCSDFKIKQKGSVNNNSTFIIAEYTSGSKNFRVYMLFKKIDANYKIFMVEFEEI